MGDRERERGCRERDVNEIAREPIGEPFDRRLRVLGGFDRIDDASETRLATEAFGTNFERAAAIDGAGKDRRADVFFGRHRFARDARFIDIGVPRDHRTVDGNERARIDENGIADREIARGEIAHHAVATDARGLRQTREEVADRDAAA